MIIDIEYLRQCLCVLGGEAERSAMILSFPNITLIGDIMIWHMGFQRQRITDLRFFQTRHFNHLIRGHHVLET